MKGESFDQIFFLFAGLFGYYSLSRLQGMRLYSLDALFSENAERKFVWKRFALGTIANVVLALSLGISFLIYKSLVDKETTFNGLQMILITSIVIASSSLVLITHRIVAAIAISFKNYLFLDPWIVNDQLFKDTFGNFLSKRETPRAHSVGAVLFFAMQSCLALIFAGILKVLTYLSSLL